MALIEFTDRGLCCKAGGFYIDPWKGVDKAVITHAHSDHARWGSKYYLCMGIARHPVNNSYGFAGEKKTAIGIKK